jgi:hypothetical protein
MQEMKRQSSLASLGSLGWLALAALLCGSRDAGSPTEGARGSVLAAHSIHGLGLGPLHVGIDVVPEKRRNTLKPGRWELVPVAILGSPGFDVLQVDRASLAFGPSGAAPSNARGWRARDVNGDGHTDLVTFYRARETGLVEGDSRACLSGATVSGTAFEGCDAVDTAPRKRTRAKSK